MVVTHEDVKVWIRQVEWLHESISAKKDDARRSNVDQEISELLADLSAIQQKLVLVSEDLLRAGYSTGTNTVEGTLVTLPQLTPRELEAAQLIAKGCTNAQIASAMFIQPQSVKNLVGSIMNKLDCSNRTQVAVRLVEGFGADRPNV